MNAVDIAILFVLLLFTVEGLGRSFIAEFLDFISFVIAFFLSLRFYDFASDLFESQFHVPHSIANVLGFLIIWFVAETIFFTITHLVLTRIPLILRLSHFLRGFAFIPALLRGIVFVSLVLVLVASFPVQPRVKIEVRNSKLGSLLLAKAHNLEQPLKSVFGGITQDTLTFFTIKPSSSDSLDLGFSTTEFKPNPELEMKMVDLVNHERVSRGLKKLAYDPRLTEIGRKHSSDMFIRGYFSHYSPEGKSIADRTADEKVEFMVVGENLAYAPSLDMAHTGLMNSAGHRANILSEDFGNIGIGIQDGGVYGLMVTQVFKN